jgi:hypothetical protein
MDSLNFLPYCIGILIGWNWGWSHTPKTATDNKAPIAISSTSSYELVDKK